MYRLGRRHIQKDIEGGTAKIGEEKNLKKQATPYMELLWMEGKRF
jgi:hypothetical protein